jgi:hypothetical protein
VRRPGPAAADPGGIVAGIHPERVIAGAHPDRGIVLAGLVTGGRPAGALWEADLLIGSAAVTCRLAERPPGGDLVLTALDPPCFGAGGAALDPPGPGPRAWPVQASA